MFKRGSEKQKSMIRFQDKWIGKEIEEVSFQKVTNEITIVGL